MTVITIVSSLANGHSRATRSFGPDIPTAGEPSSGGVVPIKVRSLLRPGERGDRRSRRRSLVLCARRAVSPPGEASRLIKRHSHISGGPPSLRGRRPPLRRPADQSASGRDLAACVVCRPPSELCQQRSLAGWVVRQSPTAAEWLIVRPCPAPALRAAQRSPNRGAARAPSTASRHAHFGCRRTPRNP